MKDPKREARPNDPYRRQPPTIDLPAGEFSSSGTAADGAVSSEAEGPPTAIEPVAATGLDEGRAETPATSGVPPVAPTPDEVIPTDGDGSTGLVGAHRKATGNRETSTAKVGETAFDPATRSEPPARRSAGGLVAAGLVGGVIGAAFAVGADTYWRQPPADYESRLAALETRPAPTVPAQSNGATGTLEPRIAALETQTRTLGEGVNAARSAAEASAKQAAEALSRPLPVAAPAPAAPPPPDPALRQDIERLGAKTAELESFIKSAAPASALDEIRTRLSDLQSQAEQRQQANVTAIAAVKSSASTFDQKLASEGQQIAALQATVGKLPPELMQAGLRVVVAGQAAEALRSGAPLGPALSALEKLGVAGPNAEPLRRYATEPAPSAAVLAAEFKPLAERITSEPQGPSASIGDRLLRIADKVVTVRAVGDGSGRDIPGLVGRIEASLARGALADAAGAWEQLPDDAKRLSNDWAARLKQRVAAEAALRRLGAESLAALDAPAR